MAGCPFKWALPKLIWCQLWARTSTPSRGGDPSLWGTPTLPSPTDMVPVMGQDISAIQGGPYLVGDPDPALPK